MWVIEEYETKNVVVLYSTAMVKPIYLDMTAHITLLTLSNSTRLE
jgi:hypothetical protein